MTRQTVLWYGSEQEPVERRLLRAGPLALEFEAGDLRYVRWADREVLRRWYVAVRDRDWGTVPGVISGDHFAIDDDSFSITYTMEHVRGGIDFVWRAEIRGDASGTIEFSLDGTARRTFLRNRIGFCVLHPIAECAGARCRFEMVDGQRHEGRFPRWIAPENPFHELRSLAHEVAPGLWAELTFSGDVFETEDQRNWTDASFKTFCTPLRLPFPAEVREGTRIRQMVTLRLEGTPKVALTSAQPATEVVVRRPPDSHRLPTIGLSLGDDVDWPSGGELDHLRALRPAHLRLELDLRTPDASRRLVAATDLAMEIGTKIELAMLIPGDQGASLRRLLEDAGGSRGSPSAHIARWMVFDATGWCTSADTVQTALAALADQDPEVPIFGGTRANFFELNRSRPPMAWIDGICFAAHPQEHAFDNASLVETCAALADLVQSARRLAPHLSVAISPLTLKRRVNPYATGPPPVADANELPGNVDPRQISLFGAAWTLASLKYLSEVRTDSVTVFETCGWRGVIERTAGPPLPAKFPSQKGMVFPLYHVLADLIGLGAANLAKATSTRPLAVDSLAAATADGLVILAANMTSMPQEVTLRGVTRLRLVRSLDESTFDLATLQPQQFRTLGPAGLTQLGQSSPENDGYTVRLSAHAYVVLAADPVAASNVEKNVFTESV